MNLDGGVALGALEGVNLFHLEGIGQQLDDRVEHGLDAVIQLARDAEEREQLHALHRFLHSSNRLVAADLASLEVSLQQGVVSRRYRFDQLLVVAVELRAVVSGDVHLVELAALGALLEEQCFLRKEIDHAVKVRPVTERHFHRNHLRR